MSAEAVLQQPLVTARLVEVVAQDVGERRHARDVRPGLEQHDGLRLDRPGVGEVGHERGGDVGAARPMKGGATAASKQSARRSAIARS